ncbi:MAG: pyruvate kinase, partial [Actinobacteria bacterium]|nr:pyruvate kinase [Actinomycetota bacterium]
MLKKTKIICTIGPSSKPHKILEKLILGGMDIARINTSYSTLEEITETINNIRSIASHHNKNTAILLDLQGPKIRVGQLEKVLKLKSGQKVIFTVKENIDDLEGLVDKNIDIVNVDYKN